MFLLLLTTPAWSAAPLSTPVPMPGDGLVGAAAGTQDQPQLVEGDGTTLLAVWRDTRASLADTLSSSYTDVWAIRVDADGVPLDEVAFPVASGPWAEGSPRGAWNGSDWLVAFDAQAATSSYYGQGVRARRVGADGALLDTSDLVLVDTEAEDEALHDVASDGAGWAALWSTVDRGLGSSVTDGRLVGADGSLGTAMRVYTPSSMYGSPTNLRLAWAGGRYLAAWNAWDDDDDVMAMPLDDGLAALSAPVGVADDWHSSVAPDLAAGDGEFYVAWFDDTYGAYWTYVAGTPVGLDGTPTIPDGTSLSGSAYPLDVHPAAAWAGDGWAVAWEWGAAAAIHTSLVDGAGALDGTVTSSDTDDYTRTPTAVATGAGALVGWAAYGAMSDFDVRASTVTSAGAVGPVEELSLAAPAQTHPALAGGSGGHLLVAESQTADDVAILAWRTDTRGNARDTAPLELARGTGLSDPAVAWNGSVWLVVWTDLDPATTANGTVGVRVSSAGAVLDATPIQILGGYYPAVGAASGGDFLVTAAVPDTYDTNRLRGVRVNGSGTVLDSTPMVLGSNYVTSSDVAALGTGWVVTWTRKWSHDDARSDTLYSVVSSAGTPGTEARVRTLGSTSRETGAAVASDPSGALVVWSDNGDIRGRRLDTAGALVGNGRGFVVNASANSQWDPDVAWNGRTYSVAWTDFRRHSGLEPGEGDVYTTNVSTLGRVSSATGLEATADEVPEGNVALAGVGGRTVYVWTRLRDEAPYGAFRVETSSWATRATVADLDGEAAPLPVDGEAAVAGADGVEGGTACATTRPGPLAGLLVVLAGLVGLRRRRV